MIDRNLSRAAQERQADLICQLRAGAGELDRKHAIALAAGILHDVLADGITGADIEGPENASRRTRQALNALNRVGY